MGDETNVRTYALTWVGQEGQFVAGFPAQDIEVEDADLAGYLVFGGCYSSEDEAVNAIAREIALTEPRPGDEGVLPRNLDAVFDAGALPRNLEDGDAGGEPEKETSTPTLPPEGGEGEPEATPEAA